MEIILFCLKQLLGSIGYRSTRPYTDDDDEYTRGRPGYEQRKRVNQAGNYVYPDHGTYLGYKVTYLQFQLQ